MSTRDEAIQRVARKIHDIGSGALGAGDTLLSDTEIGEEVDAAVGQFSLDMPRRRIVDITGQTTPFINVTNFTGWINDWSLVLQIEYPAEAVSSTYTPTWLSEDDDWDYYRDATNYYLRLRRITPASSETLRVSYTAVHTLDNTTDTIPSLYFDAVCDLAACYCCTRLATDRAADTDGTINADYVTRDGQLKFKQQAEVFCAQYSRKLGMAVGANGQPGGSGQPASEFIDWDTGPSNPFFRDRLWHSTRYR